MTLYLADVVTKLGGLALVLGVIAAIAGALFVFVGLTALEARREDQEKHREKHRYQGALCLAFSVALMLLWASLPDPDTVRHLGGFEPMRKHEKTYGSACRHIVWVRGGADE